MEQFKSITIGLPVSDLDRATEWYRQLLGDVEKINPAPGVWELRITPSAWLQLFELENEGVNPSVLRFESADVEASRDLLLRLGGEAGEIETVPRAVRYFDGHDPFGNQLSFYEELEDQAGAGA